MITSHIKITTKLLLVIWLISFCGCRRYKHKTTINIIPQRVICASPVITEIVFSLGCGKYVVGISEYTTFPDKALSLPIIGSAITPNKEKLLTLKPDMIIGQGKQQAIVNFCNTYKIRCVSLDMDSIKDVYNSIKIIAGIFKKPNQGEILISQIKRQIKDIQLKVEKLPVKRVLLLLGRQPGDLTGLTTIGPGSFLNELITNAGGANIFNDARGNYPQVSKESLLMRKPEVILELYPSGISHKKAEALHSDWLKFPQIPAIKYGNIYYMTNNYLLIPGPRMGMSIERFAEKIHPEAFNE